MAGGGALVAGLTGAGLARGRRVWKDWGATATEAARILPGDELLSTPTIVTTRAVSIDAPPDAVWPWLVQMGPGRAGAYTYDWIENLLGLKMHSADEIVPQFQDLKVGDSQQLGGRGPNLRAVVVDPADALVFASDDGNWVWAFVLDREGAGTRLISRNRIRAPRDAMANRLFYREVMVPASLVMERKMLLGLKDRAERLVRSRAA